MSESPALGLLLNAALALGNGKRIAFIHASAHPLLPKLVSQFDDYCMQQTFKPYINDLAMMGLKVSPLYRSFELILMIPSKDKVQSLGWMAQAFHHLSDSGKLMVACENQYGAKSYEAALKKMAGSVASTSKSKCRLFSAKKTEKLNTDLQQQWLKEAEPQIMASHGLWAQAGLFSWKKPDAGSLLLLKHLPKLSGKVMDLCCGYGLLAAHIIKQSPDVQSLHLVEADSLALTCATKNMQGFAGDVHTHHLDAAAEALPRHMDVVVCNPPFHTGQTRNVELGQRIITKACGALTHGGQLYVVANRQLPYEHILREHLRHVEILEQADGFKVIRGKK